MFATLKGEAGFYNGKLYGLSSLWRTKPSYVTYTNKTLTLSTELGFKDLQLTYSGHITFMGIGPSFTATASAKQFQVTMILTQDIKKDAYPVVQKLQIQKMSQFKISFSKLASLFNPVVTFYSWILRSEISFAIEGTIKKNLQILLAKYTLPIAE